MPTTTEDVDSYGTISNGTAEGDHSQNSTSNQIGDGISRNYYYGGELDTMSARGGEADPPFYLHIDDAIEKIGTGAFQSQVLLAAGLCFMADAMEVLLLSFLSTVLKHEWKLSETEVDSIVAVVFAGALLGTLVLGSAADKWGRKPVFAITSAIIAVSGVATAFCTNYLELVIARFLVGFGVGGLTVPFDTLSEFLPTASRGKNLLYIEFFWTFGTLSVPALAYLTLDTSAGASHWQLFVVLCSIPCFASTILGMMLVPESPRWLLEQPSNLCDNDSGSKRALEILKAAARRNGIHTDVIEKELFPPQTKLVVSWNAVKTAQHTPVSSASSMERNTPHPHQKDGILQLFGSPEQARLTLLLWMTWFGLGFLYYGAILAVSIVFTNEGTGGQENANGMDDDFEGNHDDSYEFDFVAIFITASSEIFGLIAVLFTIDWIGRIPSQVVAYRIGGIATFAMGLFSVTPHSANGDSQLYRYALIGMAFLARMAMMGATCTTWVSTSEMLSTDIRSTGHGAANAMARLGGFVSPYFITEGNSLTLIGSIVLVCSFITAHCVGQLPETAGRSMGSIPKSYGGKLHHGDINDESLETNHNSNVQVTASNAVVETENHTTPYSELL